MSKSPIDMVLEDAAWVPIEHQNLDASDGLPYTTHEAVLEIMGKKLRCYQLSNGQRVIASEDMESFFL